MKDLSLIQMDLLEWRPRQKVIGFPNELANDKPGSFRQSEFFKWQPDDLCHGLYCQNYPEPWLVRFLSKLDRDADRREAAKLEITFIKQLSAPMPQSAMQMEMSARRHKHRHGHFIYWVDNDPDDGCKRVARLFWHRDLPNINIQDRSTDPIIAHELDTGHWD